MTMTTRRWNLRPPDVANLFNPAFCALILNRLAVGYHSKAGNGIPYALAFLALPMLLHPASADQLPNTAGKNFHGWLLDHPALLVGFPERAAALVPIVREAIAFGVNQEVLILNNQASLIASGPTASIRKWEKASYNIRYSKDAQLLGKLLAQVGDVTTLFALFGVRP